MTHKEMADKLLREQYHCSQALFGAFAEELGLDVRTALKISTCFGGGMRQGEMCGCVPAALMILGMTLGFYDSNDRELESYGNRKTNEFICKFKEQMEGDYLCRDILGADISKPEGLAKIRSQGLLLKKCPRAINITIDILEEMLSEVLTEQATDMQDTMDILDSEEMKSVLKKMRKIRRFRYNVQNLLYVSKRPICFIQFDILRFKIINDIYGEKFGDAVLYHVIEQLKDICNENQFFINLRSDVFMVVTEYDTEEGIIEFIRCLDARISKYKNVNVHMTYGVYTVEDRQMEFRQMEDRAAMARKAVKDNSVSNIIFYKTQFKELLYTRKFIEENTQTAIAERQFLMYLQPKYSIETKRIVGAEALVRWQHPERGMIFPDEFIPVIEENGFIKKVDYYIWEEASRFIRRCVDSGITDCPISVNVSRVHLRDNDCLGVLDTMVNEAAIDRRLLELELTETYNDQQISEKAMELKEEGFKLLMDDFGSGYSSLNILLETPFDVIKLDKKFIENMMLSEKGHMILEQVVSMSERLGLGLLAEGVETIEQVNVLRNIGCDHVQGYYYAKPMPAEEFFELLKENRAHCM